MLKRNAAAPEMNDTPSLALGLLANAITKATRVVKVVDR